MELKTFFLSFGDFTSLHSLIYELISCHTWPYLSEALELLCTVFRNTTFQNLGIVHQCFMLLKFFWRTCRRNLIILHLVLTEPYALLFHRPLFTYHLFVGLCVLHIRWANLLHWLFKLRITLICWGYWTWKIYSSISIIKYTGFMHICMAIKWNIYKINWKLLLTTARKMCALLCTKHSVCVTKMLVSNVLL